MCIWQIQGKQELLQLQAVVKKAHGTSDTKIYSNLVNVYVMKKQKMKNEARIQGCVKQVLGAAKRYFITR